MVGCRSEKPTKLERAAVQIVPGAQQRPSKANHGSREMLHFSHQVSAVKIAAP
jgi:hypothetical protein